MPYDRSKTSFVKLTIKNHLMKPIPKILALSATLLVQPASGELFPNGDFENSGSMWEEVSGGGSYSFEYPTTGGNNDDYGIIDHSAANGGFGIWVGNDGQPITLASLSLEAGSTYDFTMDMLLLSGANIGGLKLDFTNGGENAGSTGDIRNDLIGEGSTWETYSFRIAIPEGVDGFKVVPLWGIDSVVGFDNIGFDPNAIEPPVEPPVIEPGSAPQVTEGSLVTWVPTNTEKFHQPQSSQDGTVWNDLGPAFPGTDTTTILDPANADFYRVLEKDPEGDEALINGDFELADPANPDCPENWGCIASPGGIAARINTDSFSGSGSIRLAVQNDEAGAPNNVSFQQNLGAAGGSVTPGESYTFSFYAKQISSGVSYVQGYKIVWFNAGGAPTGQEFFQPNFSGGDGVWLKTSATNLVAPAEAVSAFIEFFGVTGAVPGADAKGEVLLDNVNLVVGSATEPSALSTRIVREGIGVTMLTRSGVTYKAQQSEDLSNFDDLTGTFTGNGQVVGAGIPDGGPVHFFRILEIPVEEN